MKKLRRLNSQCSIASITHHSAQIFIQVMSSRSKVIWMKYNTYHLYFSHNMLIIYIRLSSNIWWSHLSHNEFWKCAKSQDRLNFKRSIVCLKMVKMIFYVLKIKLSVLSDCVQTIKIDFGCVFDMALNI